MCMKYLLSSSIAKLSKSPGFMTSWMSDIGQVTYVSAPLFSHLLNEVCKFIAPDL